jgi:hypothetical protein
LYSPLYRRPIKRSCLNPATDVAAPQGGGGRLRERAAHHPTRCFGRRENKRPLVSTGEACFEGDHRFGAMMEAKRMTEGQVVERLFGVMVGLHQKDLVSRALPSEVVSSGRNHKVLTQKLSPITVISVAKSPVK